MLIMTEPTNAVLAERISALTKELEKTNKNVSDFKKETKDEFKDLEQDIEKTRRIADEVNNSTRYVKEAVNEMKNMMNGFINVVNDQNKKIEEFIHSDTRQVNKNTFVVSILQVGAGILVAVLGFWAKGTM